MTKCVTKQWKQRGSIALERNNNSKGEEAFSFNSDTCKTTSSKKKGQQGPSSLEKLEQSDIIKTD